MPFFLQVCVSACFHKASTLQVIKKVRIEQKLVLFYLVNDVVQHSSKKNYAELVDKFRGAIKEALPHLKEDKIIPKVKIGRQLHLFFLIIRVLNEYVPTYKPLVSTCVFFLKRLILNLLKDLFHFIFYSCSNYQIDIYLSFINKGPKMSGYMEPARRFRRRLHYGRSMFSKERGCFIWRYRVFIKYCVFSLKFCDFS